MSYIGVNGKSMNVMFLTFIPSVQRERCRTETAQRLVFGPNLLGEVEQLRGEQHREARFGWSG